MPTAQGGGRRAFRASSDAWASVDALVADATGLPDWLVEIVPAMTSLSGFAGAWFRARRLRAHGSQQQKEVATAVLEPVLDERERVASWVKAYRQRHGRSPKIPEVPQAFNGLARATAGRRIEQPR
jgi:hypothetical protein